MNAVFELEVNSQIQSKILLVLHQWANCSTEQRAVAEAISIVYTTT